MKLCPSGKTPARSASLAARLAREQTRRKLLRGNGAQLKPYRCPLCRGWHVTSQKQRRRWT